MGGAEILQLRTLALELRKGVLTLIRRAGGGHIGGSLSCLDILVALYFHVLRFDPAKPESPERDYFVMSKGHSAEALFCVLAKAGFFPEAELESYGSFGSRFYGHPTRGVPGVEMPTGGLGHGLSIGVGLALAAKRDAAKDSAANGAPNGGAARRSFVLMGDGEQAEGSVWEAAMAGSHYGLDNLVGIVDYNGLQISGRVDEVMRLSPLADRWRAFGWAVVELDGHDLRALTGAFDAPPLRPGSPTLILAHTIKGRGVSFIENQAAWHHRLPSEEQYRQAIGELDAALAALGAAPGGVAPSAAAGGGAAAPGAPKEAGL